MQKQASRCIQLMRLPWKPLGMLLPGVVAWLPVPQPPIAVKAFDVVTMTCRDVQSYSETETLWLCTALQSDKVKCGSIVRIVHWINLIHKITRKGDLTLLWHSLNQTSTVSFTKTPLTVGLLHLIQLFCAGVHDIVPTARVLPEAVELYFFSRPSLVQVVLSTTSWLSRTIVPWTLSQREVTLAVTGSVLNISLKYNHRSSNVVHKTLNKAYD